VSYQTKVKKVAAMTKTFSLAGNQGLGQVALSLKDLAAALQTAFASGSAVSTSQGVAAVTSTGLRATYMLSGVSQQGNAQLTYDDATKELTGVKSPDAELAFKFVNKGRTRSWEVTIVRSKDGTTGTFSVEVTGGWTSQPTGGALPFGSPPMEPMPAEPACIPSQDDGYDPYPTVYPSGYQPSYAPAYPPSYEPIAYPSWGPSSYPSTAPSGWASATPTPPPFGGEYPNVVEAVKVSLDIKPRGDEKLAIKLDGQFNEPEAYPGMGFLVPTHWVLKASVPNVALDWESHAHLDQGKSSFKGGGSLTANTPDGSEKFLYDLSIDEASKTASFGLTNVAGKVRLQVVGSATGSQPDASLVSTEDGKHLGKVTLDPSRPRFAKVQLDDGTTLDWELFPDSLFPVAPLPAPAP